MGLVGWLRGHALASRLVRSRAPPMYIHVATDGKYGRAGCSIILRTRGEAMKTHRIVPPLLSPF